MATGSINSIPESQLANRSNGVKSTLFKARNLSVDTVHVPKGKNPSRILMQNFHINSINDIQEDKFSFDMNKTASMLRILNKSPM